MRIGLRTFLLALVAAFPSVSAIAIADEGNEKGVYLTVEAAGEDYQVQGEYVGTIIPDNNRTWGVQVIALGDGKFHLVAYPGGLPGDGYDKGESTRESDGKREGKVVKFEGNEGVRSELANGKLSVFGPGGENFGVLSKVNRESPTLGKKPPEGAVVLFDGTNADAWENGHVTKDHLLAADTVTKQKFNDFDLHIEFRTPFKPAGRGQDRGNSGVYLQSRYELQVLDSFGLSGENNECGGFYSIAKPKVNMAYPPLTWQTYDIEFKAAKYDASGKKIENARTTVKHNGTIIHNDLELPQHTPGREQEANSPAGIYLQGHGNPVFYRNVWIVEKK